MSRLAVIRIAGQVGHTADVKHTFQALKIPQKFAYAVLDDTPGNRGMLNTIKDCATWGILDDATEKGLEKRPRLQPPRGGFERKGTKKPFIKGGALGDRKDKINDLIQKMMKNGPQQTKKEQ